MQSFSYPVNRSVLNKTEDYGLLTQNYKDVTGNIETLARDIKSGYAIALGFELEYSHVLNIYALFAGSAA